MANKTRKFSTFEKLCIAFVAFLLLWLLLSSYGMFNNFVSFDARHAGILWKLLGIVFLALSVGVFYYTYSDKPLPKFLPSFLGAGTYIQSSIGTDIIGAAFLILATCANCGFFFTAGSVSDQHSAFRPNDCRVVDKNWLYDNYESFYHFKEHPELKSYVETYSELPGINNNCHFIAIYLQGDTVHGTKPSTAPRANEYFEWHNTTSNDLINK